MLRAEEHTPHAEDRIGERWMWLNGGSGLQRREKWLSGPILRAEAFITPQGQSIQSVEPQGETEQQDRDQGQI